MIIEPITAHEMQTAYFWAAQCNPQLARPSDPTEFAKNFARTSGIKVRDFFGPTRIREVAHKRQECMSELFKQGYSLSRIGRVFGRDHTTVQHGIAAVKRRAVG